MFREMKTSKENHSDVIAVTNRKLCKRPFLEQIERVCQYGPGGVILREKDLTETEYEKLLQDVLAVCSSYKVPCICHSFVKAALHTGIRQIQMPMESFRELTVHDYFTAIGVSIHSVEEAVEAEALGASWVTAGHIYSTDCKKGVPARGTGFLRQVCESVRIPVYAIGGIHPEGRQIEEVKSCGARGACVMSGMMRL